jgi:lipopolysaccharide export system protein LptA
VSTGRILGVALAAALALAPAAAPAQEEGPFGGFKHDSSKPIQITSDRLEVRQQQNIAIFSGEVEAGQGTLRLTADRVVVAYDREETDSETGAIRNMKAEGNVFLSNGAETAEGSFAEYDVASGKMYMRGEVVLTQGGNAVAGEELEIDLDTGRAEMKGGRVRSIFRPSSRQGAE